MFLTRIPSPFLARWKTALVLETRHGGWWDANKIGLCSPLIETREGWLMIYHGVRTTGAGVIYRLGLALLDLEDPTRVIAAKRTREIQLPERGKLIEIAEVGGLHHRYERRAA